VATSHEAGRREAILEAAAVVISERGVDAARLADIAEQAGVSLGLVQHYFRHRDRLLEEVFSHELHRIAVNRGKAVDEYAPPLDRLIDYLALLVPVRPDSAARDVDSGPPALPGRAARWGFWLEAWSKGHRDADVAAELTRVYAGFATPFVELIEEGVAAGSFSPTGPVADTVERLIALIDGLAVQTLLAGMPDVRMLALLVDAVCMELRLDAQQGAHARARAADAAARWQVSRRSSRRRPAA
jgi:AcrR family transcriptional regulator